VVLSPTAHVIASSGVGIRLLQFLSLASSASRPLRSPFERGRDGEGSA
jgi:hypothetical protein